MAAKEKASPMPRPMATRVRPWRRTRRRHVRALGADGHADADFVSALAGDVGNHAIDADHGEDQRQAAEAAGEDCAEAEEEETISAAEGFVEGHYVVDRKIGIERVNYAFDFRRERSFRQRKFLTAGRDARYSFEIREDRNRDQRRQKCCRTFHSARRR